MKKKEVISIIITTLAIAALIAGCLYLTSRRPSDGREKKTLGIINSQYQIYGKNIYFSHDQILMQFDTATDTLTKLCTDTECDGECVLENVLYTSRIYKNRFYFSFYGNTSGFAYYDIKTGKTEIINTYDIPIFSEFFVYDGCIYHMRDNLPLEILTVYRLSVDSGKEELIITLDPDERVIMVADGMIFTSKTVVAGSNESPIRYCAVYAYDTVTLEKREIWSTDKDRYNNISSRVRFYDGKMYFHILTYEVNKFGSLISYLCCLDTQNGEASYISDIPITDFYLTYEGIYLETEEVVTTLPKANQFGDTESIAHTERNIIFLEYNKNNTKTVYKNSNVISYFGYIANRKYIGEITYSENDKRIKHFVIIDLESGELKDLPIP